VSRMASRLPEPVCFVSITSHTIVSGSSTPIIYGTMFKCCINTSVRAYSTFSLNFSKTISCPSFINSALSTSSCVT
jgi:hypothetical protein